jgi:hypothetical protein
MSFTVDSIKDDNICVIWVDDMIDVFSWRDSLSWPPKTVPLFVDQGSYEECHGNGIRMRIR